MDAPQVEQQQPAPPQQPQPQAPQAPQRPLDMSDEGIMSRALGGTQPPRDENGRFMSQQTQQPAPDAPTPPPAETPAETNDPEKAAEAPAEQEEVPWDSVKDVKIKVPMKDGEKEWLEEVTIGQLRDERLMKADYSRKTQELAEQRRQAETLAQTAVAKEREQYMQALNTLHQSVQQVTASELQGVDWNKLAAENPAEYVRLSNKAREANEAMQRIRFEAEKVQTQQSKEQKERLDQAVSESRVKLKEAIPTWNDDLYKAILKRGVETYGFKPEEVGEFYDHRVMRVMHDAHLYRAMQEGKPTAEKKVVQVPPVLKPGNVKPKVDPKAQELKQNRDRLARNGNDIDAAAALMGNFLGSRK
jgi:hypothetical protein